MNCPNCNKVGSLRVVRSGSVTSLPVYVECVTPDCHWSQEPSAELVCHAAVATFLPDEQPGAAMEAAVHLPRSCPDCGAGIVISQKIAVCDANKYSSWSGAGDCRWTLTLTPDLRRQADEDLAAQAIGDRQ